MNNEKLKDILKRIKSYEVWNDMQFDYIMKKKDVEEILEALLEDNKKSV